METEKKGEILDSMSFDPNFKFEVIKTTEGETSLGCFQCGMCTASCPVSEDLNVKPHQVIKQVLLGMRDRVLRCKTIWACSFCLVCNIRCPQGVKPANVMVALKHIAAKEVEVPEGLKTVGKSILEEGLSRKVTEFQNRRRASLGLPQIPKIDKGLRRLLKETGFEESMGGGL